MLIRRGAFRSSPMRTDTQSHYDREAISQRRSDRRHPMPNISGPSSLSRDRAILIRRCLWLLTERNPGHFSRDVLYRLPPIPGHKGLLGRRGRALYEGPGITDCSCLRRDGVSVCKRSEMLPPPENRSEPEHPCVDRVGPAIDLVSSLGVGKHPYHETRSGKDDEGLLLFRA